MKIAALQTKWSDNEKNTYTRTISIIEDILRVNHSNFLILPQKYLFRNETPKHKSEVDILLNEISAIAKKYSTCIICGTICEKIANRIYNTCYVIDSNGSIITAIRKTEDGKNYEKYEVINIGSYKIGVIIGDDCFIPEIPRILCLKGAELLFVSGLMSREDRDAKINALWGISIMNCVLLVYCSVYDEEEEISGNSIICSPYEKYSCAQAYDDYILADIEDDVIRKYREPDIFLSKTFWWCLWGRKEELYNYFENKKKD